MIHPVATRHISRYVASRLQHARMAAGVDQVSAAARIGKRRATIVDIENGDRHVRVQELVVLARLYGKPVTWFLPTEDAG